MDRIKELLKEIVMVRTSRFNRATILAHQSHGAVSEDELDLLRIDKLEAELALAKFDVGLI